MREFILFSEHGRTSGNFKSLMRAGRLDIVCHSIIAAFFLSNAMRMDVNLHLILNGPPDPPKHIEFISHEEMPISKKDVGDLLRYVLWKYKKGRKVLAFPGIYIEKKGFKEVVEEHAGRNIYLLDENGKLIDGVEIGEDPVFILGDHLGLPREEKKIAKQFCKEIISLGPLPYFSSQCITIVHNFLDKKFMREGSSHHIYYR